MREREFSHFFGSDCGHLRFGKISCPHTRKYATYTLLFDLDWGKERIRVLFFAVIYVLGNSLILTHSNERIYTILYVLG